jgi:serine/threonine protein kinase
MALTVGSRLGPYEIQSALGAGGMGEVYKATDTNLKRAIAIKVLPPQSPAIQNDSHASSVKPKFSRPSIIRTSRRSMAWRDQAPLPRS